jgi:hypothetical protein
VVTCVTANLLNPKPLAVNLYNDQENKLTTKGRKNMSNKNDIALLPVVGWDIKYISAYQSVVFQPHILPTAMTAIDDALPTNNYVLTAEQCLELSQSFARAAKIIQESSVDIPDNMKN